MPNLTALPLFMTITLAPAPPQESPSATHLPPGGVEVELLDYGGRPMVELWIPDHDPLHVIVDTGSTLGLALTPKACEAWGLELIGETNLGGEQTESRYMAPELNIGDARFTDVPTTELSFLAGRPGVDGVIGLPCFEQCLLTFDFVGGQLRLEEGKLVEGQDVLPFHKDEEMGFGLVINVEVNETLVPAHLDTGSPGVAMFSNVAREKMRLKGDPTSVGRANTPMGAADITSAALDGTLRFGPIELNSPQLRFASLPQIAGRNIGNIGSAFFAEASITIDQASQLLRIDHSGPRTIHNAPEQTTLEGPTTVEMIGGFNWAVVEVRINGQGPFRMILDTGAGVTVLNQDLVAELGLTSTGKTRLGDPSNPEAVEADELLVGEIAIGDAYFERVPAVGWPGTLIGMNGVRGILGFPTFAECLVTLDYPGAVVEISQGKLPKPDGEAILPFRAGGGPPLIAIEINGVTYDAKIDAGNSSSLMLPGAWMNQIALVEGSQSEGQGRRASGPMKFTSARLDGDVTIGSASFASPMLKFDEAMPSTSGNIGHALLKDLRLTFDQAYGRVKLEPSTKGSGMAKRTGPRRLGMQMAMIGGGSVKVAMVVPGSEAEAAGLLVGDELIAIDGEDWSQERMFAALRGSDSITMTIARNEERKNLVLFD